MSLKHFANVLIWVGPKALMGRTLNFVYIKVQASMNVSDKLKKF